MIDHLESVVFTLDKKLVNLVELSSDSFVPICSVLRRPLIFAYERSLNAGSVVQLPRPPDAVARHCARLTKLHCV
jgi:hypothetical protein